MHSKTKELWQLRQELLLTFSIELYVFDATGSDLFQLLFAQLCSRLIDRFRQLLIARAAAEIA